MSHDEVVLRSVPPLRVAEVTATAASYAGSDIGPAIAPLYPRLMAALDSAGVKPAGPAVAYYEPEPDGRVVVHAGIAVDPNETGAGDFEVRDLAGLELAATIVHHGSIREVMPSMDALMAWIGANGYEALAWAREVYLDYSPEDEAHGVTELQVPVRKR